MEVIYFDIDSIFDAILSALGAVYTWSLTHGVTLAGHTLSFFSLWCGVFVGGVLLRFIVYDESDDNDAVEDED